MSRNSWRYPDPPKRSDKISEVGKTEDGIRCPNCGGDQFKARRSNLKRAAIAPLLIAAPLTSKDQVQCVTCGKKFKRG